MDTIRPPERRHGPETPNVCNRALGISVYLAEAKPD
jgi:hypothetical protein